MLQQILRLASLWLHLGTALPQAPVAIAASHEPVVEYTVREGDSYSSIARAHWPLVRTDDRLLATRAKDIAAANSEQPHALEDHVCAQGGTWKHNRYRNAHLAACKDGIPDGRLQPGQIVRVPLTYQNEKNTAGKEDDNTSTAEPVQTNSTAATHPAESNRYSVPLAALISGVTAVALYSVARRAAKQSTPAPLPSKHHMLTAAAVATAETQDCDYEFEYVVQHIATNKTPVRQLVAARTLESAVAEYACVRSSAGKRPQYVTTVKNLCSRYQLSQRELYAALDQRGVSRRSQVCSTWRAQAQQYAQRERLKGTALSSIAIYLGVSATTVRRYSRRSIQNITSAQEREYAVASSTHQASAG